MTFLRSPVLAIFAIILDLPNTNVDTNLVTNISARAADVFRSYCPRGQAESNHPELLVKIFPGQAAAGIGGEELRLKLSYKSTRLWLYSGCT
jgi:hypothetical protein